MQAKLFHLGSEHTEDECSKETAHKDATIETLVESGIAAIRRKANKVAYLTQIAAEVFSHIHPFGQHSYS